MAAEAQGGDTIDLHPIDRLPEPGQLAMASAQHVFHRGQPAGFPSGVGTEPVDEAALPDGVLLEDADEAFERR